eukprot:TRINITY_DN1352_c2_g1_i1.p1 TRINITY_DN1352_c2_g1~~TRINITY_DN1352_c2_g1_i1.p1  ORF type:complete len:759 (+),score=238.31 TRINITY_DN1352_c2_g1_i1:101-2377(+)
MSSMDTAEEASSLASSGAGSGEEEPLLVHDYSVASDFERLVREVERPLREWVRAGEAAGGDRLREVSAAGCDVVVCMLDPAPDGLAEWITAEGGPVPRQLLSRAFGAARFAAIASGEGAGAVLSGSELLSALLLAAAAAGLGELRCIADDSKGRKGECRWVGYEPGAGRRFQMEMLPHQEGLSSAAALYDLLRLRAGAEELEGAAVSAACDYALSGMGRAAWADWIRPRDPEDPCVWPFGALDDPVSSLRVRTLWPPSPADTFVGCDGLWGMGLGHSGDPPPQAAVLPLLRDGAPESWGAATEALRCFFDTLLRELAAEEDPEGPADGTAAGEGLYDVTVETMLKVREGPELDSKCLGHLPRGAVVEVCEVVGRRARICRPIQGWASVRTDAGDILLRAHSRRSKAALSRSRQPWHRSMPRPPLPPLPDSTDAGPIFCSVCGRSDRLGYQDRRGFRCNDCNGPAAPRASPGDADTPFDPVRLATATCGALTATGDHAGSVEALLRRVAAAAGSCREEGDFGILWGNVLHAVALRQNADAVAEDGGSREPPCPLAALVRGLACEARGLRGSDKEVVAARRAAVSAARARMPDGDVLRRLAPYAYRAFRDAVRAAAHLLGAEGAALDFAALDAAADTLLRPGRPVAALSDCLLALAEEADKLEHDAAVLVSLRRLLACGGPPREEGAPAPLEAQEAEALAAAAGAARRGRHAPIAPLAAVAAVTGSVAESAEFIVSSRAPAARLYARLGQSETLLATVDG